MNVGYFIEVELEVEGMELLLVGWDIGASGATGADTDTAYPLKDS